MIQIPLLQPAADRIPSGEFSECSWPGPSGGPNCIEPYCKGRLYRYLLRIPTGLDNDRICLFTLANPSEATPEELDPTVRRTVSYARAWGFGWDWVANARGWRETDPKAVPEDPLAIGPDNDEWITRAATATELVVCGWGKLGGVRGPVVLDLIRRAGKIPHALKLNADGSPTHPLYLRADLRPFPMGGAK